jgi:hypothetical protein
VPSDPNTAIAEVVRVLQDLDRMSTGVPAPMAGLLFNRSLATSVFPDR